MDELELEFSEVYETNGSDLASPASGGILSPRGSLLSPSGALGRQRSVTFSEDGGERFKVPCMYVLTHACTCVCIHVLILKLLTRVINGSNQSLPPRPCNVGFNMYICIYVHVYIMDEYDLI